jgi:hypothetical protein
MLVTCEWNRTSSGLRRRSGAGTIIADVRRFQVAQRGCPLVAAEAAVTWERGAVRTWAEQAGKADTLIGHAHEPCRRRGATLARLGARRGAWRWIHLGESANGASRWVAGGEAAAWLGLRIAGLPVRTDEGAGCRAQPRGVPRKTRRMPSVPSARRTPHARMAGQELSLERPTERPFGRPSQRPVQRQPREFSRVGEAAPAQREKRRVVCNPAVRPFRGLGYNTQRAASLGRRMGT